jgi:2-C-methyl-D-erythritol 2,4-cyclodiphosphate synthase
VRSPGRLGLRFEINSLRIGNGFDVHRLVEGIPLILGGVRIDYERGLAGHSDGDVLTHAVINALLGAAAMGDIGMHFPPGDPRFKGIDSQVMLREIYKMIVDKGYSLVNVDAMIICERPKLSPHYTAMRETLARTMSVDVDRISVKASTAEGLGTIGSGLGIAAQTVALITK